MTPERDDWDSHWDRYASAASRNPAQQMRHATILRLLARDRGSRTKRVLDLGSGQGDFLAKLRAGVPGAELLGVELSRNGVEISRRKIPGATFIVADIFQPPPELRSYVAWATHAVCSEVLEHVDSPPGFLRAARPYLASGARLIVTVPGGPMSAFDRHIGHRRHFDRSSLTADLRAGGFEVERVYLSGFPFFNLYRAVVIARGTKLANDVESGHAGASSGVAGVAMTIFRGLFRLNLPDSPFGWQVVAVARKSADESVT